MKTIETEGKTRENAVAKALKQLGVDNEDQLDIEVLAAQGGGGLLGIFGNKTVKIRASLKAPPPEPEAVRAQTPSPFPAAADYDEDPVRDGQEPGRTEKYDQPDRSDQPDPDNLIQEFFSFFNVDINVEKIKDDEHITYKVTRVSGDDLGYLIGKHGATLSSIQYLINTMAIRRSMAPKRIIVDVENYRDKRRRYLETLAANTAEKVLSRRKEVVLSSLLPHERKIVHTALSDKPEISTYSKGEGAARKLVVYPRGKRRED